MPINFEQPVPVEQASVIGQVQQYNLDRQYQLQQQALAQHSALARQQQAGQMAMAQAQMSLHAQQANAAQRPSDRDVFLADQQAGMQQAGFAQQQAMAAQHLQAQQQLQQEDWTHAEEMQLQQAKQAKAALLADDSFSPEEKALGTAQIDARINPWEAKKQRTIQKQRDLQTKQMMDEVASQESIRNLNLKFQRGEVDQLPTMTDPVTGAEHRMLQNRHGEWYDPFKGARHEKDATDLDPFGTGASTGGKGVSGTRTGRTLPEAFDYHKSADRWSKFYTPKEGGPTPESEAKVRDAVAKDREDFAEQVKQYHIEDAQDKLDALTAQAPINPKTGQPDAEMLPDRQKALARVLSAKLMRLRPPPKAPKVAGGGQEEGEGKQQVQVTGPPPAGTPVPPTAPDGTALPSGHYKRVNAKLAELEGKNAIFTVDGIQYAKSGTGFLRNEGPPVDESGQTKRYIGTREHNVEIALDPYEERFAGSLMSTGEGVKARWTKLADWIRGHKKEPVRLQGVE